MASKTSTSPSSTSTTFPASCTTAIPDKYGHVPITACNAYYNFNPSFSAALAVAVLFALLTLAHLALAILTKKRYAWVLLMGATWETLAFILGALGAHHQQNLGFALAHQLLFLLAPLWINAFVYMTFARTVYFFLPDGKVGGVFRAVGMSKWFVGADVVTFIVQAVGGVMVSPDASASVVQTGIHVYMGGLGLQEAFIVGFLVLMVLFHRKVIALERQDAWDGQLQSSDTDACSAELAVPKKRNWRGLLYALYAVLAFISMRIFYRMAEYGGGISPSNPIPYHEAYSYALDAFPMMVCLLILAVVHPGRTLVGPDSHFPKKTRAEKKAEKAEKKAAEAQEKAMNAASKQGGLP